jgi:hypothetical protein
LPFQSPPSTPRRGVAFPNGFAVNFDNGANNKAKAKGRTRGREAAGLHPSGCFTVQQAQQQGTTFFVPPMLGNGTSFPTAVPPASLPATPEDNDINMG